MRGQRFWHTLRLFTILSAAKRTQYYKTHNILHSMGGNCLIMDRRVPLYAKLISLGDNVKIGSNVIIGACSLVNKDIPDNCVVAGVPARIIETFDEYLQKRNKDEGVSGIGGEMVTPEAEKLMWERFSKSRERCMMPVKETSE